VLAIVLGGMRERVHLHLASGLEHLFDRGGRVREEVQVGQLAGAVIGEKVSMAANDDPGRPGHRAQDRAGRAAAGPTAHAERPLPAGRQARHRGRTGRTRCPRRRAAGSGGPLPVLATKYTEQEARGCLSPTVVRDVQALQCARVAGWLTTCTPRANLRRSFSSYSRNAALQRS